MCLCHVIKEVVLVKSWMDGHYFSEEWMGWAESQCGDDERCETCDHVGEFELCDVIREMMEDYWQCESMIDVELRD